MDIDIFKVGLQACSKVVGVEEGFFIQSCGACARQSQRNMQLMRRTEVLKSEDVDDVAW